MEPKCPESVQTWFSNYPPKCNLNDKYCLLETGYPCSIYEDYLKELEEVDLTEGRGDVVK